MNWLAELKSEYESGSQSFGLGRVLMGRLILIAEGAEWADDDEATYYSWRCTICLWEYDEAYVKAGVSQHLSTCPYSDDWDGSRVA